MNRSQTPIHQPENYQFYQTYVGAQQSMIPQGYIQNGNFYPVMQPMIVPLFPIQQGNNVNKHQTQIINQQQHQQQPGAVIIKKPYANMITNKPSFKPWTSEEDQNIMNMVNMHGAAWDGIARSIPDRSGIDIQNRYNELNNNRIVLPMPSIQSRPSNSFYEDNDSNNENKEENSNCFMKHVSYNLNSGNPNFVSNIRGPYPSQNQNSNQDNFEFIQCQYAEDENNIQNTCVLPFMPQDNEFNGIDF